MFTKVFQESVSTCFNIVFDDLKRNSFSDSINNNNSLRSPPLASLLPQIKSLSSKLLPSTIDTIITTEIKEIYSGTSLESLSFSIIHSLHNLEE